VSQFLYYLPGKPMNLTHGDLLAAGLRYAFPEDAYTRTEVKEGPAQGRGALVADKRVKRLGYYPAEQTWLRGRPAAEFWVGWQTDDPPAPEDLARETAIGTAIAPLGDGRKWLIPRAQLFPEGTELPEIRHMAEDGSIVRRVAPQHEQLLLMADAVATALRDETKIPPDQEWKICVEALRVNYRVSNTEIDALGLLSDEAVTLIFWVLCDRVSWPDAQKQIAAEGQNDV